MACCPKNEIRTEQSPGSISIPIKGERWPEEKARTCYKQYDWLTGCNFISSTAINSLEFCQEDIFDPRTFSRELGWSANIVFNPAPGTFAQSVLGAGFTRFLKCLDEYLALSDKHDIKTMFVLLDDVWHPVPKLGKQPEPAGFCLH